MSEVTSTYKSWEEVIVNFFENKIAKSALYKARAYVKDKEQELKSESDEKKRLKLAEKINKNKVEIVKLRKELPATEIRTWLDEVCKKKIASGTRIIKATHLLRFGHSSSASDGINLEERSDDCLLTTASMKRNISCDMAHNNGNLITISRFLALSHSNEMIIDLILSDNLDFLKSFSSGENQLSSWKLGLGSLVERREIKNADMAKQIYFPIDTEAKHYNLLVPLLSSAMAEEIYTLQNDVIYSETLGSIRKTLRLNSGEASYHSETLISYPNVAVQKFGGAQPQNVSMLNKSRTWKANKKGETWGVVYLINAAPPAWKSQPKPPIYQKSFFDSQLRHVVTKDDIEYLRDFLMRFEQIELSIKHPERKKWIAKWVSGVIDDILFHASSIQNMPSGWSATEGMRLKPAHQLFLDPYREDEAFQAERKANTWQFEVCEDFARWLNWMLVGKEKTFSPQTEHTRMWVELMEAALREYDELVSLDVKTVRASA